MKWMFSLDATPWEITEIAEEFLQMQANAAVEGRNVFFFFGRRENHIQGSFARSIEYPNIIQGPTRFKFYILVAKMLVTLYFQHHGVRIQTVQTTIKV